MANPMVQQLDYLSKLQMKIDGIREDINSNLPGSTPGMKEAKANARKAGAALFDAVTDYQRAMLNELYKKPERGGE